MGYIQIPKLIGGGDEPTINIREMPQEWEYFKTLKEATNDQAYLFYKGGSGAFTLSNLGTNTTVTIYGGSNGTTPLYQYKYASTSSQRKWYHWNPSTSAWVLNTTQGTSTQNTNCKFTYGDLTNYPLPFGLSFYNLTGKSVANDPHIGTTELFTVIVHNPSGIAISNMASDSFYGAAATSGQFSSPLIAYSGYSRGIRSATTVFTPDLEFAELVDGSNINAYQFYKTYWLGKVVVPSTINTLGNYAFAENGNLQEVDLSSTALTAIPTSCFQNSYHLKKIKLPSTVIAIANGAFYGCYELDNITLPSTVTSLGNTCFYATSIKKLTIPSLVTDVGDYMLENSNVEEVTFLPTNLTLGYDMFKDCHKLNKVTLPSALTEISESCFENCYNLSDINLPNTIELIGQNAFAFTNLSEITLGNNLTEIGDRAFYNCPKMVKATLPNTITTFGAYMFQNNVSLKTANIPTGISSIPTGTFYQCSSLESVTIPANITKIEDECFFKCFALRTLELPSTLTQINYGAFNYCGSILYFKFKSTTAPTLSYTNAFENGNTYAKILVPYEGIRSYQTSTNWSSTTNSIKAKQRGYKTFTQGDTLPSTDLTGNHNLTWYENLNDILKTTATGTPTATPITTAPYDGEFYCTIA